MIAARFEPERYHPTQEDRKRLMASPMLASADTSKARYVWLPIQFEEDRARIDWRDEWGLDEFKDM